MGNSTSSIPDEIVSQFYQSRTNTQPKYICHAPFNNMYFNSLGHVANCWLTFHDPEVYTPDKTIKEIWNSDRFKKLRQHIENLDLDYKCSNCKQNLLNRNFVSVLARAYDNQSPLTDYPSLIELELDNSCNLECTMCTGLLSSSIRRNREKLSPLLSPYGDKFVSELNEFIPHLTEIRFNGGEPFLIKVYWQIWDNIVRLKPSLRVVIATNGTVLNERVKDILARGNFHLNISIDGLTKETYNNIRVNGDIDKLMQNFLWFRDFCARNNRVLCVMVNPMRQNWWEMGEFLNFCNRHGVHIWYNFIERPLNQALWSLPANKLQEIYDSLSNYKWAENSTCNKYIYKYNVSTFENLVHKQIAKWLADARKREADNNINNNEDTHISNVVEYMNNNPEQYTSTDKENVIAKLKLLEQSFDMETKRSDFRQLITNSPPAAIAESMKSYPFEEAKKLLSQFLDGGSY